MWITYPKIILVSHFLCVIFIWTLHLDFHVALFPLHLIPAIGHWFRKEWGWLRRMEKKYRLYSEGIHEETLPPAHTLLGILFTLATSFHTHQFLSRILLKSAHSAQLLKFMFLVFYPNLYIYIVLLIEKSNHKACLWAKECCFHAHPPIHPFVADFVFPFGWTLPLFWNVRVKMIHIPRLWPERIKGNLFQNAISKSAAWEH